LARQLYHSLHEKLLQLPDATAVFPAHGAGSSCGKHLSSETTSTIGEQRRANYALQSPDENAFVATVTEGQPAQPHYFQYDARRNRELRPLLDADEPPSLTLDEVVARQGAVLVDPREPADFAAGHLRGAVNVGLQGRFAEWTGDVVDPGAEIVLVGDPSTAVEAKVRLARVGFDRVVGQLDEPGRALARAELVDTSSRLTVEALAQLLELEPQLQLVDVRNPTETEAGVLPHARAIPLATLTHALHELDPSAPVVVYCNSGYRSQVAASVLVSRGFSDVSDVIGGYTAWHDAGRATTTPTG
jgi:rhodanese-related sulfurtransferase